MECGVKSIQGCLNCKRKRCLLDEPSGRTEYMAKYVKEWRSNHPTYNRDWMRAYRAKQKEAAV